MAVPMYICLAVKSGAEALCTENNRSSAREAIAPTLHQSITRMYVYIINIIAHNNIRTSVRRSIIRFVHQFGVFILYCSLVSYGKMSLISRQPINCIMRMHTYTNISVFKIFMAHVVCGVLVCHVSKK